LLFALARYGGLRCPSEVVELTWADVNWEGARMLVRAPKTEHHEGHEERVTPIFPELRPYLEAAWDEAADGATKVCTLRITGNSNLRTQMHRIIRRAGLVPWPKLFVNMRATRATELAEIFPGHVCAAWLGHSNLIADRHYRQLTDEHFAKAAGQIPGYTMQAAGGNAVQQLR
jgi:integrase